MMALLEKGQDALASKSLSMTSVVVLKVITILGESWQSQREIITKKSRNLNCNLYYQHAYMKYIFYG